MEKTLAISDAKRKSILLLFRRGYSCYEPFSGSGGQFIAAEKLGRRCFGLELEPAYCDVILARWEKFTGKAASLSAGKAEGT